MKIVFRIILVAACCQLLAACGNDTSENSQPDYTELSGKSGKFTDHRGKWMVINYWATWCKPCIEEIPELNRFAKDNADKVVVFAVDFDNAQGDKLIESSQKLGITFPILINDPHELLGFAKPYALPTTFIFNPDGQLQQTLLGPQTQQSLLQALVIIDKTQLDEP